MLSMANILVLMYYVRFPAPLDIAVGVVDAVLLILLRATTCVVFAVSACYFSCLSTPHMQRHDFFVINSDTQLQHHAIAEVFPFSFF